MEMTTVGGGHDLWDVEVSTEALLTGHVPDAHDTRDHKGLRFLGSVLEAGGTQSSW